MEEDKVKNKAKRIMPKIRFKPKIDFGAAKYEKIKVKYKRKTDEQTEKTKKNDIQIWITPYISKEQNYYKKNLASKIFIN